MKLGVADPLQQLSDALDGERQALVEHDVQALVAATSLKLEALRILEARPPLEHADRLRELAERIGRPAYLIDGAEDLRQSWFEGKARIGITAGASAPEVLVLGVVAQLREWGAVGAEELDGRPENVTFSMPKELRVKAI